MLRKTLIALTAVAALGMGSTAMAARGMGGHPGSWGGHHAMAPVHGAWGGRAPVHGAWGGRVHNFSRNNFAFNRGFHHRFRNRNAFFFGVGFAGPYYDSCWVWTPWGLQWACGYGYGYPYGGYGYPYGGYGGY
jgi:hypothetical protein